MLSYDVNIFDIVRSAGPMVLFVLLVLLFFSVASWAIILIKYRYIKWAFKESAFFTDFFWKSRDLSDAFAKAKQLRNSPIARIFRVGYLELRKIGQAQGASAPRTADGEDFSWNSNPAGVGNIQRALRRATNTEVVRMTQLVPFLATTGNTAPFIGLFGTVWGIMSSFHGIGLRGSASLAVVAPGISEALIATAAGLAAAIPAVIAFNYFMQKIRILESELHSFSADFLNIVERDIMRMQA